MRFLRLLASIILPTVTCGLASAGVVAAAPAPDACGTPIRLSLMQDTAAVGVTASGSLSGTVDGYEFRGAYELASDDVRTLPVDFSASLEDGPARIVALVITYDPYNFADIQPEETVVLEVEPALSTSVSVMLEYDTEFVRLNSVYIDIALCGPLPDTTVREDRDDRDDESPVGGSSGALPSTGGSDATALVALAALLLGVGAALIARRPAKA